MAIFIFKALDQLLTYSLCIQMRTTNTIWQLDKWIRNSHIYPMSYENLSNSQDGCPDLYSKHQTFSNHNM